jgi:hypothetical protein
MTFMQGLRRLGEVRGPQWRQARLNGISVAGAAVASILLLAGLGEWQRRMAAAINAPGCWAY